MIGGFLQAHTENKKHENIIETLNGISNGFSLTFFSTNHYKLARQTAVMMIDFLLHNHTIVPKDIEDEQRIIAIENTYHNNFSGIDAFDSTYPSLDNTPQSAQRYQELYERICKQHQPIVILQGNFGQPEVTSAYTYLKYHLRVTK